MYYIKKGITGKVNELGTKIKENTVDCFVETEEGLYATEFLGKAFYDAKKLTSHSKIKIKDGIVDFVFNNNTHKLEKKLIVFNCQVIS